MCKIKLEVFIQRYCSGRYQVYRLILFFKMTNIFVNNLFENIWCSQTNCWQRYLSFWVTAEHPKSIIIGVVQIFSWEPALWTLKSQDRVLLLLLLSKKKHCNFRLSTVTFEPRHENKSCLACPEDQLKPSICEFWI